MEARVQPSQRTTLAALALTAAAMIPCSASADDAFSGFAGRWKGSGSITMTDGSRDMIRCRADNATDAAANALHLNVNCASDSYRVNIVADVRAQGSTFSGSWQETTRQIRGDVVGAIPRVGQMQASLQTLGGGIELGATANGKRQAITLHSQGTEVRSAEITLRHD